MIPHAIVRSSDNTVVNCAVWDRVAEWSPGPGMLVIRLDNQLIQPSIGWTWNPHTKTFAPPVEPLRDGKVLLGLDGNPLRKPEPTDAPKPQIKSEPVKDPIRDIPHRDINWKLCDQGFQSPKIFRPKTEVEDIYTDRMSLEAFQYVTPKAPEVIHER